MNTYYSNSWLNGAYRDVAGYEVCINSSLSFASFDSLHDDEDFYFQGNEADDVIGEIADIWNKSDVTQNEAIAQWIRMHL